MSDTPRTDANLWIVQHQGDIEGVVPVDFARTQERELANAKDVQRFMTDKCLEAQEIARLAQNEIIDLRSELAADKIKREAAERRLDDAYDSKFVRHLERELAEARQDAERYRWLRDQPWVEPEATARLSLPPATWRNQYHDALDAAIDAARKDGNG